MSLEDLKRKVAARQAAEAEATKAVAEMVRERERKRNVEADGVGKADVVLKGTPIVESQSRDETEKDSPEMGRARKAIAGKLSKIVRKAISMSELITDEDRVKSAEVLRGAKEAVHYIYSKSVGDLVPVPDQKTRLAAVTLELAYTEGTPVARSVSMNVPVEDGGSLKRALESPALRRHLQAMLESTNVVEAEVIQESGGGNSCSTTEKEPLPEG